MKIRLGFSLLTAILETTLIVGGLWAQNVQPVLSVTGRNTETIVKNLSEIAQVSKDLKGTLITSTAQSFLEQDIVKDAVDLKRPFGFFLFGIENEIPDGVCAIPVADLAKAFKLLPAPIEIKQINDKNWNIVKDDEILAWVYSLRDWCFLTKFEKSDAEMAAIADDILKKLDEEVAQTDLGVSFYVNGVPEEKRKEVFEKAVACAKKELEKGKFHIGEALVNFVNMQLDKLTASAKRNGYESPISKISSGYVWNSEDSVLSSVTTLTGDKAKRQIEELAKAVRNTETAFANFGAEGSVASFQFNAQIEKLKDPIFEKLLEMQWEHAKTKITRIHDSKTAEEIVNFIEGNGELFKNVKLNMDVETAGALFADEKDLTIVLARNVPDGYALETAFQKVVKWVGDKKAEKIAEHTENAKRTENGDLHIFQGALLLDKPLPGKLDAIFNGKVTACIIFAPKAVYAAIGTNTVEKALECIKNAKKEEASIWSSRLSAQGFIQAVSQYGDMPENLEKKLKSIGETEISTKIVGLDNGICIVTEFPAKALEMFVQIDAAAK